MLFNISRLSERTNYWNIYAGNIFLFLFSGGILVTARFFPIDRFPLGFCAWKYLTGFPCPTCGFTRAFCDFANGRWAEGIYLCPFALVIFVLMALVFLYNAISMASSLFGLRISAVKSMRLTSRRTALAAVLFFLLILVNWIYRLAMGLS